MRGPFCIKPICIFRILREVPVETSYNYSPNKVAKNSLAERPLPLFDSSTPRDKISSNYEGLKSDVLRGGVFNFRSKGSPLCRIICR